jgi:predicted TIM-barrel fold metal-dependent hydrolase
MIIDSHCHAWRYWPYEPPVPDPEVRGRVEQLIWEMDRWGVDQALLVCARIDHNPDNNDYGAYAAVRYPDRLVQISDVDCSWWPTYHTPGAAGRLREEAARHPIAGFTHYVGEPDGWFGSPDGIEFFEAAAELNLIASIAASPQWQPAIRDIARRFPTLPILCHHLGGLGSRANAAELLESAAVPNILIKVSGFHYSSEKNWDFPYAEARENFRAVAAAFGPQRLCWGSDFPASRDMLTYRQSLEAVRSYGDFLGDGIEQILGGTMAEILRTRRPIG